MVEVKEKCYNDHTAHLQSATVCTNESASMMLEGATHAAGSSAHEAYQPPTRAKKTESQWQHIEQAALADLQECQP